MNLQEEKRQLLHDSKKNEKLRSQTKLSISVGKSTNKMCAPKHSKRKAPKGVGGKKKSLMFLVL